MERIVETKDFLAEFEKAKKKIERRTNRSRIIAFILLSISFAGLTSVVVTFINSPLLYTDDSSFVEKSPLNATISTMIRNGASLDIVKHVYDVRKFEHPGLFKKINLDLYYTSKTPLSSVLNGICSDYFSSDPFVEDSLYYARLIAIIRENQFHNPFDNLEESQVSYFENIRIKTDNEYELIQDDVVRIASELSHKNQLVDKYLSRSNLSFIISIVALILTIGLSCFQIYQSWKMNKLLESNAVQGNDEE